MRTRPEIVVATPGRMIDLLMNSRAVDLDDLSTLVLDEVRTRVRAGGFDVLFEVAGAAYRTEQALSSKRPSISDGPQSTIRA